MKEKRKNIPVNLFNELKAIHDCSIVYSNYKGSSYLEFPDELRLKLHDYDYSEIKCTHIYYFRDKQITMYTCGGDIMDIFIDPWDKHATDWIPVEDELPETDTYLIVKTKNGKVHKNVIYGSPYMLVLEENIFYKKAMRFSNSNLPKIIDDVVCWTYQDESEV